jgi:hypothetical protein
MAESDRTTPNPLEPTADRQRELPDKTGRPVPLEDREFADGGEGNSRLWDGHIIDASDPLV